MTENGISRVQKKHVDSDVLLNAEKEFRFVIIEFILPLLEEARLLERISLQTKTWERFASFKESEKKLLICPCRNYKKNNKIKCFVVSTTTKASIAQNLINTVLDEITRVSEFVNKDGKWKRIRRYSNDADLNEKYRKRILELAFELAICYHITGNSVDKKTLHSLIEALSDWSLKTYEGSKVPFGVVVDFSNGKTDKRDWEKRESDSSNYLGFLKKKSSFAFSDGVYSGVEIDRNCRFLNFIPHCKDASMYEAEEDKVALVPYSFRTIARECENGRIGLFLQMNGDILIVKNGKMVFAKRNGKWVFYEPERFSAALYSTGGFNVGAYGDKKLINHRINCIYSTLLDVSFSHRGCCLGILNEHVDRSKALVDKVIKDPLMFVSKKKDIEDGRLKYLRYIFTKSGIPNSFFEIPRRNRSEMLSLDGATVINTDGTLHAIGSILALPGGSSDGGRSAAAKALANLGVGIKVSEDGYIEVFFKARNDKKTRCIFSVGK